MKRPIGGQPSWLTMVIILLIDKLIESSETKNEHGFGQNFLANLLHSIVVALTRRYNFPNSKMKRFYLLRLTGFAISMLNAV